ncbi:MAG: T9SS type A sorting domain-containing protein [Ignavibacteriae bacterium]|nr:T9SS type A sorting domain-containing protein [Ignavibacteriota bacterium]
MKKKPLILSVETIFFIILLFNISNFGHSQRTHQYAVREAYKLLEKHYRGSVPDIKNNLGNTQTGNFNGHFPLDNGTPWTDGKIVAGAFREDEEDVIYHIGESIGDVSRYAWASVSHFWNADDGPNALTNLSFLAGSDPKPNAYQKIMTYATSGNGIYIMVLCRLPGKVWGTANLYIKYNSLPDLYKNRNLYITRAEYLGQGSTNYNPALKLENSYFSNGVLQDLINIISWEVLGRMTHLIADMSVPAHVHNDDHAGGDGYEDYMGHGVDDPLPSATTYWDANRVFNAFGNIMNPYVSYEGPLYHLMYTVNQLADHFASNDANGDDTFDHNNNELEQYYPYGIGPTTKAQVNQGSTTNYNNIRNATFPHSIRAIAGLFHWFVTESNLQIITPSYVINPTVRNVGTVYGGYAQIPGSFSIYNNGQIPIQIKVKTTNPLYDLDISTTPKDYEKTISLAPWQTHTINYHAVAPLYAGSFTEVITIDAIDYNIHKTHTIIGTVPIPDFCFAETNRMMLSPEEQLFDEAFLDSFYELDTLDAMEKVKLKPKDKMKFAYEMFELPETELVSNVCMQSIKTYPNTEMDMAFYALNVLWESALEEPSSKDYDIKDFIKYLKKLAKEKKKYRVYGYGELILSLIEEEERLEKLTNVYNNYSDQPLAEISLFYQFIYYFIQKDDIATAKSLINQMDKEFKYSKYTYQAHMILEDVGFTLEGLKDLIDKNDELYYEKPSLAKKNIKNLLEKENIVPNEYLLSQNYPNPFNPITSISYSIPDNLQVSLKVYNSMGQLVKTLVSRDKLAGTYNIVWDSTNESGNIVSSGTYIYVLTTPNKVLSNKMILLK